VFTVEFYSDHVKIVSIDETGEHDDVNVYFEEDGSVILSQPNMDYEETEDVIIVKYQQLLDILAALHQTEGTFQNRKRGKN
jgi:hypothetical protein